MLCALIGYGPGLGKAYAEVFGQAGYDLALLSRTGSRTSLEGQSGSTLRAFQCDAGDPKNLRDTLQTVEEEMGEIDVVIHNADLHYFGSLDEIMEEQFEQSWRVASLGLYSTAKFLGS